MCSVLRVVRVHVRDGVLVVHRIVLKRDVVMRKGVTQCRSHLYVICRSHLFVNMRCRVYSLYTYVPDPGAHHATSSSREPRHAAQFLLVPP